MKTGFTLRSSYLPGIFDELSVDNISVVLEQIQINLIRKVLNKYDSIGLFALGRQNLDF